MKKIEIHTFSELIAQGKTPEILFWVGCAGSFDERAKKITKPCLLMPLPSLSVAAIKIS